MSRILVNHTFGGSKTHFEQVQNRFNEKFTFIYLGGKYTYLHLHTIPSWHVQQYEKKFLPW